MEVTSSLSSHPPPAKEKGKGEVVPKKADFQPSVWGDYFIHSITSIDQSSKALIKQKVEDLKVKVKGMLINASDVLEEMKLVDALQQLELTYHFEKEIDEKLAHIYESQLDTEDLHVIALRFRLLRQEGYHVHPDEFNKFKDIEGKLRTSLSNDFKALFSLYEAAYLSMPGEVIFDEAINFCKGHLMSMLDHMEPHLATQVTHALDMPSFKIMKRLKGRHYISIYEKLKEHNDIILYLAKLDFNLLQLLHREEIKKISMWWKELGLILKLTFARDRVVECYYWALGTYFEPHLSHARIMLTKVIAFVSILDDMYDAYGTLEELQLFTDVIERWDIGAINQLPEYMQLYFLALDKTFETFEDELRNGNEGNMYCMDYLKAEVKALARAYFQEAKWGDEKHVPTFEEHLQVSLRSSTCTIMTCVAYIGMGDIVSKKAFDWLTSFPKIIEASSIVCRIKNDIVSCEREQKQQDVVSTIECYMKEHLVSKEGACEKLREIVEDAWKVIVKEFLQFTDVPKPLLLLIINFARMSEVFYQQYDAYTDPSEDQISLLLNQSFPIN